jgi:hypothetical protein
MIVMARKEAARSSNIIARTLDITNGCAYLHEFLGVLQISNVIAFVDLLSVTPDMFEIASNHPNVSMA